VRYSSEISVVGRLGKFGLGVMKKKAEGLGADFVKALRERLETAA
jgi:carbon monoxide dehydrogenase subunit G